MPDDLDPITAVQRLDDRTPFLLLPVRFETRFGQDAAGSTIRIRIYPDDVAIAHHEGALTAAELEAGHAYWRERCRANGTPDARERRAVAAGAWAILATRHGAPRASWIARATRPVNFADTLADPGAAVFPQVPVKEAGWSEAPRAFALPDCFVVRLVAGGVARDVVGSPIPADLALGPDPLQPSAGFSRDSTTGRLVVTPPLRWLVSFDDAVNVGMALRIPLDLPREANGFDRIVVLGMRSASPGESESVLERLLEAQRYSRGVSIVRQGTSTNATDGARSGLPSAAEGTEAALAMELEPPAFTAETDHFAKSDGQRLAEALALPLAAVQSIPLATCADVAEALAMNRALWSATLGDFLHEMIAPAIGPDTIERLRRFFGGYVVGRGLLPALRVGSQPYGVLATSALARWEWTPQETGDDAAFWSALTVRLRQLEGVWRALVADVSHVGKAGDPFHHLLAVIGLQATSVEFHARKAVARDYLANYALFRGLSAVSAMRLWEAQRAAIDGNLTAVGFDVGWAPPLRDLVLWREHDLIDRPLVDADPRVPFSEKDPIAPFDGTRNYIAWLRTASATEIREQRFVDANGAPLAPPRALLYALLRDAFLAEMGRGGRLVVNSHAPAIFAELAPEPAIVNVGAVRTFTTGNVLDVGASRIGASTTAMTVGEHLVQTARAWSPGVTDAFAAAGLADLHAALHTLAPLPTARLERLLAEHVDLCSYRLDAWIQGIVARRLGYLRSREGERPSLHLGAYGYAEDVRPAPTPRQILEPAGVPLALQSAVDGPILEHPSNGGYVHAPSLTHAATAAVLRSGYLSHAEPSRADAMAVNLSSRRVRTALGYLAAVRDGHELAALLGYQLERGLHENHSGVELDAFVYVLRDRFPFTSRKLTDVPDGTAVEAMEARNVVNGYDLLDTVRGKPYPYGIAGLPDDSPAATATSRAQAAAVRAEIDALMDAMDAIADVALAEGVHQLVQGNVERAKGILQTVTDGGVPPDLEVVETLRSGRSLTFRLVLPLDPAALGGWGAGRTPRAKANQALNAWLASALPPPADIQWRVQLGTGAPEHISLASLNLQPLDCVLMAGEHLGDLSGELERWLVHHYRDQHGVADDVATFFFGKTDPSVRDAKVLVIDPGGAEDGKHTLASVFPLLRRLRQLVTRARPLAAPDLELPSVAQAIDAGNPKGLDDGAPPLANLMELKGRVEQTHDDLTAAWGALQTLLTNAIDPLYVALTADPAHGVQPQWNAQLPALRQRLVEIAGFGIPEALPTAGLARTFVNIDALVAQARATSALVARKIAAARAALDTTFAAPLPADPSAATRERARRTEQLAQRYTEAAQALLGKSFLPLPLFRVHAAARAALAAALTSPVESRPLAIEEWLQSIARVRAPAGALALITSYQEWLGRSAVRLVPLQLPARAGDAWIGGAYGAALGPGEVISVVLAQPLTGTVADPTCGLLLDEWTELVPVAEETTGIAFHFDRPNATAPQALLLAISPRLRGAWDWEDLVAVVLETFDRAKMRAVEPDQLLLTPYFQVLPTILSEFSAGGVRNNLFTELEATDGPPPG